MNGIEYKFALVVEADILPVSFPNTQTKIDKLHITLIGGKSLKQHKAVLKTFDFSILPNPPAPLMDRIGEASRVVGDEERITTFVSLSNQDEFREYVSSICSLIGIDNPEPSRFFHISVANNHGGNPFKSVGDIDESDLGV